MWFAQLTGFSLSTTLPPPADPGDFRHLPRAGPAANGGGVRSALVNAEQQHEERVKLLKQTHLGELTAVKVDYEGKLTKVTAGSKAETALSQQREVGEGAAQ
ncbi:hypothetical protein DTO006G1_553 [Penicillium roqueforti]|nr:hypothetical protein CBS147337_4643 [Penicillium roqueforti]KAI2705308.1 hypothetical protein CBS147372_1611 [Penicillium roqueforti]KAI2765253.1 hypothetical protein DTO006G1_553 [Penicillium roqueforti]KAI3166317.1 hypothetical protein CBS147317_2260 [Penicillium roqueforti]KAI3243069.1 hypothetical protein DTO012A7_1886 [Penicillium roqueforti]